MTSATRTFLVLVAGLLPLACQQPQPVIVSEMSFSRPVGADPGGTLAAPVGEQQLALLARVPDAHFAPYAEEPALLDVLHRLDRLADELPASAQCSARELAKANAVRGQLPSQFFSEEEALVQEEQYLALGRQQRIALATQAMKALLASPAQQVEDYPGLTLRSFDALDVEMLRGAIGGYMGRTLMAESDFWNKADKAQWLSRRNSEKAYKRIMARMMLEDVAANRSLPGGTRCAAILCLQSIYTEQELHSDGGRDKAWLCSALPGHGPIPTLLSMGDMRFCCYDGKHEAEARVAAFMTVRPRSAGQSAEALARASMIARRAPGVDEASGRLILSSSPAAWVPEQDILRAEQQYKSLSRQQRVALAKEVMFCHLTQPLTPCYSEMWGKSLPLRSFDKLDVEAARRKAGGIFAEDIPSAAPLFKRMVARILLEEKLADHSVRESCLRHAAMESLQHICREALSSTDGDAPLLYMVDALPAMASGLEQALFGGRAW